MGQALELGVIATLSLLDKGREPRTERYLLINLGENLDL